MPTFCSDPNTIEADQRLPSRAFSYAERNDQKLSKGFRAARLSLAVENGVVNVLNNHQTARKCLPYRIDQEWHVVLQHKNTRSAAPNPYLPFPFYLIAGIEVQKFDLGRLSIALLIEGQACLRLSYIESLRRLLRFEREVLAK